MYIRAIYILIQEQTTHIGGVLIVGNPTRHDGYRALPHALDEANMVFTSMKQCLQGDVCVYTCIHIHICICVYVCTLPHALDEANMVLSSMKQCLQGDVCVYTCIHIHICICLYVCYGAVEHETMPTR
jgi:hypothetical protein